MPARYPNTIREYRVGAGLTQRELGERVGATRSMVSIWERGRSLPTLRAAFRLARSLDTFAEHLYQELFTQARSPQRP